jgi:hypothetical protein
MLGRWFEELCRIKHPRLREIAAPTGDKLRSKSLPNHGGIYAFWWTGDNDLLNSSECNRILNLGLIRN